MGTNSFLGRRSLVGVSGGHGPHWASTLGQAPQGGGCSDDLGGKGRGPQRFQTGSQRPELTRASGRRRGPQLRPRHQPGAAAHLERPHLLSPETQEPPHPPRFPGTHAAMAQPSWPATSSGRIRARAGLWAGWESRGFRLPASGLEVSLELGSGPIVPGGVKGEAVGGRCRALAPVLSGGGCGASGQGWRGRP